MRLASVRESISCGLDGGSGSYLRVGLKKADGPGSLKEGHGLECPGL